MNVGELKRHLELIPNDIKVHVLCTGYGNEFPADWKDIRLEPHKDSEGNRSVVLLFGKD